MKLITARFGEVEVTDKLIIQMTKPILGFEHLRRYIIVETEDFEPFRWYQAVDDPEIAFVIVNPLLFFPEYVIEVNPKEIEELKVKDLADVATYAIVTVPPDYTRMTANLQGPLLLNVKAGLAKQLVLVNSEYGIRHRLLSPDRPIPQVKGETEDILVHA